MYLDLINPLAKTVLFGVLNWGLGHATRSIPIIQELLDKGLDVIIASDGSAGLFLEKAFPNLKHEKLLEYDVRYVYESVEYSLMVQLPGVLKAINAESKAAEELSKKYNADLIISDSRFGFRSDRVKSIVIAHQLQLISSKILFTVAGNIGNRKLLNQFDECWIPDFPESKLSGALSQKELNVPIRFIGPLSRLTKMDLETDIDLLVIISGPEPRRSEFLSQIKEILKPIKHLKIVGVEGNVEAEVKKTSEIPLWYNFLNSDTLNTLVNRSRMVLCRAGYSSIMDLAKLEKPAILIPTKGQSEQEYLSSHLDGKMGFTTILETELKKLPEILTTHLK